MFNKDLKLYQIFNLYSFHVMVYMWCAVPLSMCGMFSAPAAAHVCCFG